MRKINQKKIFSSILGIILGFSIISITDFNNYQGNLNNDNLPNLKVEGSDEYIIEETISDHIWSPDGTKVAYIKSQNQQTWNCELWVADKNPNSAQLTNHQLIYTGAAYSSLYDWKDDWILFSIRFEDGSASSYYGRRELWKIKFDGTFLTQVTFTHTNGIRTTSSNPTWINEGTVVMGMFIPGTNLVYFTAHNGNGWYRSYVCNDDGTDNWQHRSNPDYSFNANFGSIMDPNGNKLLWGHATYWNDPTTLRSCNVDGSERNTIKSFTKKTYTLALADGNTVVWDDNDNIYAIDMDGSNERTVIDDTYINRWWNYNPVDGQELIMTSNRLDGNMHLFRIKTNGTGIVPLTEEGPYNDEFPIYSPDGQYLMYRRLPSDFDPDVNDQPYPYELVIKSLIPKPTITITSPVQNDVFDNIAPNFEVLISGISTDTTWYTIDGGITNITFSGLTGTIDQTEWDKQVYGDITIRFYVNNSLGIIYYAEVRVIKACDEWKFLREISIDPSIPEDNYQIKIELNPTIFNYSKTKSNGGDIRFLDDNYNPLPYWIETWNPSGTSIIWVKIFNSGTSTIYMKYGNELASSESNGDNVFIFFDDFEGTDLNSSKWYTDVDIPGAHEIADAHVSVSNSIAEIYLRLDPDVWGGYPPEMRWEDSTIGWNDYWANGQGYGYFTPNGFTFFKDDTRTETESAEELNNDVGGAEWTWFVNEIQWINSSLVKFYEDDVLLSEHTDSASFPTEGTLPIKFLVHGGSYPNGDHYLMSLVSNNNYNEIGYSLRTLARREWNGNNPNDLSLTMHTDWILIHKCNQFEPIMSIGPEMVNKYPPIISVISPINNDVVGINAPDFEISIIGDDINCTWYTIDNGATNITFTGLVGTIDQTEWDKKGDEMVFLRFYVNNTLGNSSYSEVTIKKDTIKPIITINSPHTNELFGKAPPEFDITVEESNIDLMWYTLDDGLTNISHSLFNGIIDQSEWNKHGNGPINLRFYVLDKAGNNAFAEVTIIKEVSEPIIIINAPLENGFFGNNAPTYNISVIEPDLEVMWYTLDDGLTNLSITEFTGIIDENIWDSAPSGPITIKFYAKDTLGNIGYAEVVIEKDVTAPTIQVNIPSDNDIFGYKPPNFIISITDTNLDSMWYTLDNGITQIPLYAFTGTIDQTEWDKKGSGTVPIRFYANDTVGNIDYIEVIVIKDLVDPIVNIISPNENEVFGNNAPIFEISISEVNLDSMWYTLDNGITNIPMFSYTGTIDQTEWNKKGTEDVIIKFYASDQAGNEGFAEITVIKDIDIPIITINSPKMNDFANSKAPSFDITVQEPHIDLMWYTLDYGINNYYFTEFTGTINQGEWDKFSNGTVVIRFYVKDEGGNEAFSEISVNKDTFIPIITIHAPELGADIVDFPPVYGISIEEANLDTYWYSIDDGLNNHSISTLTGIIDESVWNSAPDGPITITFYAKDKGGNIGFNEVIVVKRTTIQPQQQIPGYNLFILLGMVSFISMILIKRKFKS